MKELLTELRETSGDAGNGLDADSREALMLAVNELEWRREMMGELLIALREMTIWFGSGFAPASQDEAMKLANLAMRRVAQKLNGHESEPDLTKEEEDRFDRAIRMTAPFVGQR